MHSIKAMTINSSLLQKFLGRFIFRIKQRQNETIGHRIIASHLPSPRSYNHIIIGKRQQQSAQLVYGHYTPCSGKSITFAFLQYTSFIDFWTNLMKLSVNVY